MFKIGDKVKCIYNGYVDQLELGKVYTITQLSNQQAFIRISDVNSFLLASRFELVKEESMFKVGDKVRALRTSSSSFDNTEYFTKGNIYTVTGVLSHTLSMIDDRGYPNDWDSYFFELVKEESMFKVGDKVVSKYGNFYTVSTIARDHLKVSDNGYEYDKWYPMSDFTLAPIEPDNGFDAEKMFKEWQNETIPALLQKAYDKGYAIGQLDYNKGYETGMEFAKTQIEIALKRCK